MTDEFSYLRIVGHDDDLRGVDEDEKVDMGCEKADRGTHDENL